MARTASSADATPFNQINVTPFIDIMLVLLIMLIMTIPIGTHKVPVTLPAPSNTPLPMPDPHVLAIDAQGILYWDGRPVRDEQLAALLADTARTDAPLALRPDPDTRYDRFDEVLARVRRAGVTRLGFTSPGPIAF